MLMQDTDAFIPSMDERALQAQLQELMCYLWDNYLQLYDSADEIFLMGVGNAYLGIKVLLINRGMSKVEPIYSTWPFSINMFAKHKTSNPEFPVSSTS